MDNLIKLLTSFFQVKSKVTVKIQPVDTRFGYAGMSDIIRDKRPSKPKKNKAKRDNRGPRGILEHRIYLYTETIEESGYSIEAVLAHEFIHVFQYENQDNFMGTNIAHGKPFADISETLSMYLKMNGYNISVADLYNPETDIP